METLSLRKPTRQPHMNGNSGVKFSSLSMPRRVPKSAYENGGERPFKILVRKQTFTVDSREMSRLSPIFAKMCFGSEYEDERRELAREIVDESAQDMAIFFECLQNPNKINEWNFDTLLRLADKYQVNNLKRECEQFIQRAKLQSIKPDQILTLLIAASDYHLNRSAIRDLVFRIRMAGESNEVLTRLKLNRYLPPWLSNAVISTNLNMRRADCVNLSE